MSFDLLAHLYRQLDFSIEAYGPDFLPKRTIDHIKEELVEIEEDPFDLEEWIDVIILACHGALKSAREQGQAPQDVIDMLVYKQTKNENRNWPDWRTADPNKPINHIKE